MAEALKKAATIRCQQKQHHPHPSGIILMWAFFFLLLIVRVISTYKVSKKWYYFFTSFNLQFPPVIQPQYVTPQVFFKFIEYTNPTSRAQSSDTTLAPSQSSLETPNQNQTRGKHPNHLPKPILFQQHSAILDRRWERERERLRIVWIYTAVGKQCATRAHERVSLIAERIVQPVVNGL